MSLEQALVENTAALKEVAVLLKESNAARADLLAKAGVAGNTSPSGTATTEKSVKEIKESVSNLSVDQLREGLAAEKAGSNRSTAVKAYQEEIDAREAETTAAAETPAPKEEPKADAPKPAIDGEALKSAFGKWFGETDDESERAERRGFVEQIVKKLGARISELKGDDLKKAAFYLARKRAGVEVDFSADYDFDGDPTAAPAAGGGVDDLM